MYMHPLIDELGEEDVQRLMKVFETFDWNIPSLLAENNAAFIRFMRDEYSMNTRRMYCTKLSRVFASDVIKNSYPSAIVHQDALMKWKATRRAINAEEDKKTPSWKADDFVPTPVVSLGPTSSSEIRADAYTITEKALELVAQNNVPAAIRFMVQMYVKARTEACTPDQSQANPPLHP